MRVAVFEEAGRPFVIGRVADPVPLDDEVVIKVHRCGICGSDVSMTGGSPFDFPAGMKMGHEYSGEVVAVGRGVSSLSEGDRVTGMAGLGCGRCRNCLEIGNPVHCEAPRLVISGFGEYMPIPERAATLLPETASFADGALVEPMGVALHAIEMSAATPGSRVLDPAIPSWWVVDAQFMKTYMFCATLPGRKKPKAWYESGSLKTASTIEALAVALDIDPATLRATIDRFNTDVRQGRDTQFGLPGRARRCRDVWRRRVRRQCPRAAGGRHAHTGPLCNRHHHRIGDGSLLSGRRFEPGTVLHLGIRRRQACGARKQPGDMIQNAASHSNNIDTGHQAATGIAAVIPRKA